MKTVLALALVTLAQIAEPDGYRAEPMRGEVPATLAGGTVIDDAGLDRLLSTERPLLIDVSPQDARPPGVRLWLPTHRSIPGSRWLPGAGEGALDPARAARLAAIARRARAVVVFCHPGCWASWNAARRLVRAGHPRIFWYPAGIEGWQERHDSAVVRPDAEWVAG